MNFRFSGEIWYWRGPAPFHFVTVPPEHCEQIRLASSFLTYGWGMIPVMARIGGTDWYTAMWSKDGGYILPLKAAIRKKEGIAEGDTVDVELALGADAIRRN